MTVLPLVKHPDPRLRQVSRPVEAFDTSLRELLDNMTETMIAERGVGLSAVQVGIPIRALVVLNGSEQLRIVNPRIWPVQKIGEEEEVLKSLIVQEGCLSCPGETRVMQRYDAIGVEYFDEEGLYHRELFDQFLSVVIQHELDHLDGKLIVDYASS